MCRSTSVGSWRVALTAGASTYLPSLVMRIARHLHPAFSKVPKRTLQCSFYSRTLRGLRDVADEKFWVLGLIGRPTVEGVFLCCVFPRTTLFVCRFSNRTIMFGSSPIICGGLFSCGNPNSRKLFNTTAQKHVKSYPRMFYHRSVRTGVRAMTKHPAFKAFLVHVPTNVKSGLLQMQSYLIQCFLLRLSALSLTQRRRTILTQRVKCNNSNAES